MSRINIERYYNEVEKIIRYGGNKKETAIRSAFYNLLNSYCESKDFILITELGYKTSDGHTVYPDGTVKDALRLDWGYWESKDTNDDLDAEIEKKFNKGYPKDNILFEDSETAVLIQGGEEKLRTLLKDEDKLDQLLTSFINYERPEVRSFRDAIEKFKEDIPTILETLREQIAEQAQTNTKFQEARKEFLELCKEAINPDINYDDIREMMIQHILTDEIFTHVYNESHFHKENNIAKQLQKLIDTFFTGQIRKDILTSIESYYLVIKREASNIPNHKEKQKFLKVIYENFYKVYNPKGADRLGIIYTPDEIVNFIIENTDYLLNKHFGKLLSDKNVEILDPATGTGTFITDLIEYIPEDKLEYKYENEIHANEVSILPYYIANLNIEYTYKQKTGKYKEFQNICFVDTLDNMGFGYSGRQEKLFGLSVENLERIKKQNEKEITVIIGNPPYNANQLNFNDFNKNREYPEIDKRIKDTYIDQSTAQKTKLYDMYTRFLRWASDRISNNGIIAFVSNNSFINSRTYDGFRKVVAKDFNEIWIIDLKGNARTSGERRRKEAGNVFDDKIRVGIAIYFLVKKEELEGCNIYYNAIDDHIKSAQKRSYLRDNTLKKLPFEHIRPSTKHNWINLSDNNFDKLIPLAEKDVKAGKSEQAILKLFSNGINTARDEWLYSFNLDNLREKISFFSNVYNKHIDDNNSHFTDDIKWSRDLRNKFRRNQKINMNEIDIKKINYRPFVKSYLAINTILIDVISSNQLFFRKCNKAICFNVNGNDIRFLATDTYPDWHFIGDTKCIPLYRFDDNNNQIDNITDWGIEQFCINYNDNSITKESVFHYTYGVFHNPAYRAKYVLNLKREYPRLPFYKDFWKWANWGEELMDLHINYETVVAYDLEINTIKNDKAPKPKLKADKVDNRIILDTETTINGIPSSAWDYMLGNRSALEWILDQYKEKKPRDPTIREKFNTYKFADYKDQVIDLITRVTTVSVRTVEITKEMEKEEPI